MKNIVLKLNNLNDTDEIIDIINGKFDFNLPPEVDLSSKSNSQRAITLIRCGIAYLREKYSIADSSFSKEEKPLKSDPFALKNADPFEGL
jgi:hypothetical protein